MTQLSTKHQRDIVASLRALMPNRALSFEESLRLAELQANHLLKYFKCEGPPFRDELIAELPRIEIRRVIDLFTEGVTRWHRGKWQINIRATDTPTRQRFTLCHEIKHILDASIEDIIYGHLPRNHARDMEIEAICNAFAAALLMPKKWIKRAWSQGMQNVATLAWYFEVSPQAMQIRLQTLGLTMPVPRCANAQRLGAPIVRAAQNQRVRRYYRYARISVGSSWLPAPIELPVPVEIERVA